MNSHIPVTRLSEYIEGFLSEEENSEVEAHLSLCEICRKEFSALQKICDVLRCFSKFAIKDPEAFVRHTMVRARKRRILHLVRRYAMPASAAAVILIVAGVSFFDSSLANRSAARQTAFSPVAVQTRDVDYEDNVSSDTKTKDIITILEKNSVQITKVTSDYVEGEALLSDYQNVRHDFDFTDLPPTLLGQSLNLAGAGGAAMQVGSANRSARVVTFRIRRK
jgi:hypothetical protein